MSWPWLPIEIYPQILYFLPASRDSDVSVRALASCIRAGNSTLKAAAMDPILWEAHYRERYTHSDLTVEPARRAAKNENWYKMYILRRGFDRQALRLLDEIVRFKGGVAGRHRRAEEIVKSFSFDVWDALELEASKNDPFTTFHNEKLMRSIQYSGRTEGGWTHQYWAKALLGVISRQRAIVQWRDITFGPYAESTDQFEATFNGLSAFFGHSPQQITRFLDQLSIKCIQYITAQDVTLDKTMPSYDLSKICVQICDFMRSQGYGPADGSHFHDIMNHFPYYFLKSGQKTLPISLVYIFVALARRLGIDASPVDFPSRVIAYVAPVVPNDKPVYVDVFGSHAQAILSLESDIPLRLAAAGMPLTSISALVRPAPAAPMLLRATRNIYSSFGTHPLDGQSPAVSALASATYVAMCAIGVLGPGTRPVIDRLIDVIDRWPLDGRAVLVNALAPALDPDLQKLLREKVEKHIEEEDEKASRQYARDRETKLKFFVGQTFRHARYNYQAVIIGWTIQCSATETWILRMHVDDLPNGRNQPFYDTIDLDGNHRYVAECNIIPEALPISLLETTLNSTPSLGRYFVGEDCSSGAKRGRLIMAPELQMRFPDDSEVGAAWALALNEDLATT